MKGASAEPAVINTKKLIKKSITINGISQYFFLVVKNPQNSFSVSILFIDVPFKRFGLGIIWV